MGRSGRRKRKPQIHDLSRAPPTEGELDALLPALATDLHPVTAAILGAAIVEHYLEIELRRRLPRKDDATWAALLADNGPLNTFAAKITLGHALKLYDADMRDNLNIVRTIRNQFAHSKKLLPFDHYLIDQHIKKSKPIPGLRKSFSSFVQQNKHGTQFAYISLCMLLGNAFLRKGRMSVEARARRMLGSFVS
jgi:hypothetical protein